MIKPFILATTLSIALAGCSTGFNPFNESEASGGNDGPGEPADPNAKAPIVVNCADPQVVCQ